jgi:hypothetical protein
MQASSLAVRFDRTRGRWQGETHRPGRARHRLRALDQCLNELEEASALGCRVVTPQLAARVSAWIRLDPGMSMALALDRVFQCQRECMSGVERVSNAVPVSPIRHVPPVAPSRPDRPALTTDEAKSITAQIKNASGDAGRLLLEAHDRRAWRALGYHSWHKYVRDELSLSRSRSYELLDQARVIAALETATGMSRIPDVPVYAAAQLKPRLGAIVADIESCLQGVSARESIEELVVRLIDDACVRARANHRHRRPARYVVLQESDPMMATLAAFLQMAGSLPPPQDVVEWRESLPDVDASDALRCAAWFEALAHQLAERRPSPVVYSAASTS